MASASTLHPPFLAGLHRPAIKSNFLPTFQVRRNPIPDPTNFSSKKFPISAAASSYPSPSSSWEREEIRWLREEQRWLREEQRWRSEGVSLIREIAALRLKIEALEHGRPPPPSDLVDATISEVGARPAPVEEAEVKKMIFEEVVRVNDETEKVEERKTLRMGSEGKEVRAMQDDTNGTPIASMLETTETTETVIKEPGDAEVEIYAHRVFLLGENRWEEPSRLKGRDKPTNGSKAVSVDIPCLSCHGEGRLTCTECDGSGEPNIEPQFVEWIDENAKCPYCEGLGYTTCDVCEGKYVAVQI